MKYALILAILVFAGCNVSDDPPLVRPSNNTATNNTSTNNTSTNNTSTNNTSTNNTSTNNIVPCDTCTNDQVCFEELCCTPAAVESCGATQCGMIDDGCGGAIECACAGATDVCIDNTCCTPMTPEMCTEEQCGMVADGCGGMVDCGVCTCTANNFETFCPTRACEVVSGCVNEECVYAPLSCSGQACECPAGGCDTDGLTDCRDPGSLSCPAQFCDPSPSMDANGNTVFANVCVQPAGAICDFTNLCAEGACSGATCAEAPCGLCNLGGWDCDAAAMNAPTCYDIPPTSVDAGATNCNDNTVASTFIYLDHITGFDDAGSGSRAQPFRTIGAATAAAQGRGAKGIIVRDGLVLTSLLEVQNGISLYGGYSGAPNWKPVSNGTLQVNVSAALANGNVVAVRAANITERTVLHRVRVTSGNATAQGSSTYGIHAFNSPGLVLSESRVQSGNGPTGTAGASGAAGRNGGSGFNGSAGSQTGGGIRGNGGGNFACISSNGGLAGNGGYGSSLNGVAGTSGGNAGGAGGTAGISAPLFSRPTAGGHGASGAGPLFPGVDGAGGVANYTITNQFFVNNGSGANGTNGSAGRGGGGGGGGGGGVVLQGLNSQNHGGGGGGGGGAGGCGGAAGTAGQPGGSSFGLFAINSTGLQVIDTTILSGNGGRGGAGGTGGNGGDGGAGGGRGTGSNLAADGGLGGAGQNGTRGGHAGGGAGGVSVGIYCEGSQIAPSASTVTAGARGLGGVSSGADGEPGFAANLHNCN